MPSRKSPAKNLKIVKFKSWRERVDESSIDTLKEALKQARAGDVKAVGICVVRPTGSINTSFSETDDVARLLGAAALLKHRILLATEKD